MLHCDYGKLGSWRWLSNEFGKNDAVGGNDKTKNSNFFINFHWHFCGAHTQKQTARFFTDSEMDEPILTADGENHFNALRTVPAFRWANLFFLLNMKWRSILGAIVYINKLQFFTCVLYCLLLLSSCCKISPQLLCVKCAALIENMKTFLTYTMIKMYDNKLLCCSRTQQMHPIILT